MNKNRDNYDNYDNDPNAYKAITENPIILDFNKNRNLWDIHVMLKEKFGFPDYYGKNWDALWDLMRDLFYEDYAYTVELHGFYSLPKDLQEKCKIMLEVFDDVVEESAPYFSYKIVS